MPLHINRDILETTLRGYAEVNAINETELRQRLSLTSATEHWATFDALYETWELTGKQAGGDWEALARQRLNEAVALRQALEALARRTGRA